MTISQVTPYTGIAPARVGQTQTEFSNNGDDMNAYFAVIADSMNLSIDGINLAVIDIDSNTDIAEASAEAAASSANFKGEWSDLTGALNIPASVFHNDSYWQLINNLADVTLSEPTSLSADWKISYSELNGIARGLNQPDEAIKYGRAGEVLGVEVLYIYNPVEEVTWELPALTQPDEVIVSVTLDELITDIDTYVLIPTTPITKISDSLISASSDVAASSAAAKELNDKILPAATQPQALDETNNTASITPLSLRYALNATGSAPIYATRAWVNLNGVGAVAIRDSGNISSIVDTGTGSYTVNLIEAAPSADYAILQSCEQNSVSAGVSAHKKYNTIPTVSSFAVLTLDNSNVQRDVEYVYLAIVI